MIEKSKEKKLADIRQASSLFGYNCRDEATRTPDPYVPNVVRYQLRYIPMSKRIFRFRRCKGRDKSAIMQ